MTAPTPVTLSASPFTATEYRDGYVCASETRYAVSAVYDGRGESRACDPIVLNFISGIGETDSDDVLICGSNGFVRITGGKVAKVTVR